MCERLVGLPDVDVLAVDDQPGEPIGVVIETRTRQAWCPGCGERAEIKDRPVVELIDLPCFGRPARLVWRKRRWRCGEELCEQGSWTETASAIASSRVAMTARAARWVTEQVGRWGRSVNEVAVELGCAWHTINDTVRIYGTILIEDPGRIGTTEALGLDEMLMVRRGPWRRQEWVTSIVDVAGGQLLELVEGRNSTAPARWIRDQPESWRSQVRWATLDLSGSYRATFTAELPHARQVADPFHLVRVANQALDECRRRVQNQTLGHRGRRDDPLYRARRRLTMAAERLTEEGTRGVLGLLAAGDPHGEVRLAWSAKETLRGVYDLDAATAAVWIDEFIDDTTHISMPAEVRRLGRTVKRWRSQILAWHDCRHTNGPTESMNNLAKRIKRVAFGFRSFANFRIRALLYAGRPNWTLLASITP